jgi:integrase/recombinase XerD
MKISIDENLQNPCETPFLRKMFRPPKRHEWKILEKEAVDEMIFRTVDLRDRIMLELMARGGIRMGTQNGDAVNLFTCCDERLKRLQK